jgi:hypothetical protein
VVSKLERWQAHLPNLQITAGSFFVFERVAVNPVTKYHRLALTGHHLPVNKSGRILILQFNQKILFVTRS